VERAVEVLKVENLSVEVYGRVIVRGVDLTVSEGDVLYIVGPERIR